MIVQPADNFNVSSSIGQLEAAYNDHQQQLVETAAKAAAEEAAAAAADQASYNLTAILINRRPDLGLEEVEKAVSALEEAIAGGYVIMSENATGGGGHGEHVDGLLSTPVIMVGCIGLVVIGLIGYGVCFVMGMRGKLDVRKEGPAENKLHFKRPGKNNSAAPYTGNSLQLPVITASGSDHRSLSGSTDESIVIDNE